MSVSITNRADVEALIEEQLQSAIIQDTPKTSVVLQLGRRLRNMSSNQTRMRVTDELPMAYWVDGDIGMKQTSKMAWDNVFIDAAELAVIVPVPEAVLDDTDIDIMGEITPRVMEAIGQKVDGAILFGDNRPKDWRLDILTTARQAGNNVSHGANPDYYGLLLAEGGVIANVEASGEMVTGAVAAMGMRAKLRGIRGEDGHPIFKTDMQGPTQYALDGAPMYFPKNGSFDQSKALLIVGNFSQLVYAIRKDLTVKILDQGVIQDPTTKEIVYNLAQQDMIALRVVFRMGWALPNPATRMDEDRVSCPFAYLEPATAMTTKTVTFTVQTGADQSATAIEGAVIDIDGARLKTNASGQAVFNLPAGTYKVKVKASGYVNVQDTVTVASAAVTKTVTLTAAS